MSLEKYRDPVYEAMSRVLERESDGESEYEVCRHFMVNCNLIAFDDVPPCVLHIFDMPALRPYVGVEMYLPQTEEFAVNTFGDDAWPLEELFFEKHKAAGSRVLYNARCSCDDSSHIHRPMTVEMMPCSQSTDSSSVPDRSSSRMDEA